LLRGGEGKNADNEKCEDSSKENAPTGQNNYGGNYWRNVARKPI